VLWLQSHILYFSLLTIWVKGVRFLLKSAVEGNHSLSGKIVLIM